MKPIRMCVGCRQRSPVTELLRVVVDGAAGDARIPTQVWSRLAPDPHRRLPGRGAHVHLDPRCLDLAERRRSFGRALGLAGPVDVAAIREYVVFSG